jgi:signal transduction histidine kinase
MARIRSLRTQLLLLVLCTALPLVAILGWTLSQTYQAQRQGGELGLVNHVRLVAVAIDRHVSELEALLRGIASWSSLEAGDLKRFQEHLQLALTQRPGIAITVVDGAGSIVLQPGRQGIAEPISPPARAAAISAWRSGTRQVFSPNGTDPAHRAAIGIAVPVTLLSTPEQSRFVLLMQEEAAAWQELLPTMDMPAPWIVAFIDGNGIVVARNKRADAFVGTPIPPQVQAGLAANDAGFVHSRDVEGVKSTIAYAHAPLSGFSAAIAIPAETFDIPLMAALRRSALFVVLLVAPALMMAIWLSRRIATSLQSTARALAEGVPTKAGFREIDELNAALRAAWRQRDAADLEVRTYANRLRGVLDAVPINILLRNRLGRVSFANVMARHNFGDQLPESSASPIDWVHPEDRSRFATWRTEWLAGADHPTVELRWRMPDGAYRWHLIQGSRIHDDPSGLEEFCSLGIDIHASHEVRMERERAAATLEAEVALRTSELSEAAAALAAQLDQRELMEAALLQSQKMEALGQLTGGAAHDFNNVLAAVENSLGVISTLSSDIIVLQAVEIGQSAVDRAHSIIRHLLAFARKQDLSPDTVDIACMVVSFEVLCRQTIGEAISLECDVPPDVGSVLADGKALQVALLNLAANARDAMPEGGRLTLRIRAAAPDGRWDGGQPFDLPPGDYIVIGLEDTGLGMSPEVLARATEPFFTTKRDGMGTGLGLAMVYGFARQSGGTLRITSKEGKGTMVEIVLPSGAAQPAAAEVLREDRPVQASARRRVLVVDDNASVRRSTAMLLSVIGYDVMQASSADEAYMMACEDGQIDLVLSDMVMPGGGGRQLANRLHAALPKLPIVLMTGFADETDANTDWVILNKPFSRQRLCEVVEAALVS